MSNRANSLRKCGNWDPVPSTGSQYPVPAPGTQYPLPGYHHGPPLAARLRPRVHHTSQGVIGGSPGFFWFEPYRGFDSFYFTFEVTPGPVVSLGVSIMALFVKMAKRCLKVPSFATLFREILSFDEKCENRCFCVKSLF